MKLKFVGEIRISRETITFRRAGKAKTRKICICLSYQCVKILKDLVSISRSADLGGFELH